jgi:hypothetical protein
MTRKIQKITADLSEIPCPFDLREHAERVETGPVQFNDDWPGVFIRGDNAAYYAIHLNEAIKKVKDIYDPRSFISVSVLENLLHLLRGSHITNIEENDDTNVGC